MFSFSLLKSVLLCSPLYFQVTHKYLPFLTRKNVTIKVATMFLGTAIFNVFSPDPLVRQTLVGHHVLNCLQQMYGFNVSYIYGDVLWEHFNNDFINMDMKNSTVDLFIRPSLLLWDTVHVAYPLEAVLNRRYGFTLYRPKYARPELRFYGPFTGRLWRCLVLMSVVVSMIFYLLSWWEKRMFSLNEECSFWYELLVAIGAYCQHSLPTNPILSSRRVAYITFFIFSYVIYSYYTSNLLSHLVSDRNDPLSLNELIYSHYDIVTLDSLRVNISSRFPMPKSDGPQKVLFEKLTYGSKLNVTYAMEAVKQGTTAVLSDFITLYPFMRTYFNSKSVCHVEEIDVITHIQEYMFASRDFAYKEQFKIGILRVKEAGILKHLFRDNKYTPLKCSPSRETHAELVHVSLPLIILACSYVIAALLMVAETMHFKRNMVWPYVE